MKWPRPPTPRWATSSLRPFVRQRRPAGRMRGVRPRQLRNNVLTTTVDGLWALQVLTGIETVAPELGLRPHLPSVEPKRLALGHPVTTELRDVGVIDESGAVSTTVVEWLTVLSRRD